MKWRHIPIDAGDRIRSYWRSGEAIAAFARARMTRNAMRLAGSESSSLNGVIATILVIHATAHR